MIPQAVVFDLGKVLLDFDYGIATRKLAGRSPSSAAEVEHLINHTPLLLRLETGEINNQQFYREVCAATGFGGSFDEFSSFFADIFTPIEPMVELHARLRARRVPTFIFSNTNDIAMGHIRRNFPFMGNFDGYVLSYEHGVMKPGHPLYEVVERMVQAKGESILYLDDRQENIDTGLARGWQVIHHETPEETRAKVRQMGLLDPETAAKGGTAPGR